MSSPAALLFVEFPEQVPAALEALPKAAAAQLVALTPHAALELERLGQPFQFPEEFFDERELDEFGIANYPVVERLCTFLDACL